MRLSDLIRDRKEPILADFEKFARTHTSPGTSMDIGALRDHASGMLDAFARELEQPQTPAEQERKAKGDAAPKDDGESTAAEEHGLDRARRGFSLDETFAEYRALRASVTQHWTEVGTGSARSEVEDLIRFNEAIDKAIAESIHEYSKVVRRYRDMFLAVLGHDLRSPLNAVLNASTFLTENARLSERDHRLAQAILGGAVRMRDLIDDMLDYTSSQLGAGMPLRRSAADMGEVADEVVRQSELTHPGREFRTEFRGDLTGHWDQRRIRQALLNLIDNAVQHGSPDSAVTVSVSGDEAGGDVVVSVHNLGVAIPAEARERIFEPFQRGASGEGAAEQGHDRKGLGLYIARRMAEAHGGAHRWIPPPKRARRSRFAWCGIRRTSPVTELIALSFCSPSFVAPSQGKSENG
jgi:signal transduction histidine kinase